MIFEMGCGLEALARLEMPAETPLYDRLRGHKVTLSPAVLRFSRGEL
jgi:hypothetical protein